MTRPRRTLLVVGSVVLALFAVMVGSAALLLGTEQGARWMIAWLSPDGLKVERVEGRLLGPLYLGGIEYRTETMNVSLDRFELDWAPREILRRTLHVLGVDADGVRVLLRDDQRDPEQREPPRSLHDIELPIGILLDRARVTDIEITAPDADTAFRIDDIVIAGGAAESKLVLNSIDVHSPDLRLAARGTLTMRADYPVELDIEWSGELPDTRALAGSGAVRGTLSELHISHELTAPARATVVARVRDLLHQPRWRVETTVPTFVLPDVREGMPAHELGLRLTASGGLDSAQAKATFAGLLQGTGAFDGDLQLSYADTAIAIHQLALRLPTSGGELAVRGNVSLAGERPRAILDGEWTRVTWPLEGETTFASPTGTFRVAGDAELFRITAHATAGPAGSPPGRWQIRGEGTRAGFELRRVRGDLANGHVEVAGSFAWTPGSLESLDGRLRFTGMHKEMGPIAGGLRLRYREPTLRMPSLAVQLPGSDARLTATGELLLQGDKPHFSLRGGWQELTWPLQADSLGLAAMNRSTTPSGARRTTNPTTGPRVPSVHAPRVRWRQSGRSHPTGPPGSAAGSRGRSAPVHEASSTSSVAIDSRADTADAQYASPSGEFEIIGDTDRYRVTLAATLAGGAVPAGRWALRGEGTPSTFAVERLYGETLDGRVRARGEIGWDPSLSWSLVATADRINPGAFVDRLPGLLGAEVVTRGTQQDGEWNADLQLVRLDGRLRGQPFDAFADVRLAGDAVQLDTLVVRAGTAELAAAGGVSDEWDMAWRLDAPELSTVYADAAGRLAGAGTVKGARSAPMVRVELSGDSLAFLSAEPSGPSERSDAGPFARSVPQVDTGRSARLKLHSETGRGSESRRGSDTQPGSDTLRSARADLRSYNQVESLRAEAAIDLSDQVASTLTLAGTGITAGGFVIEEARVVGGGNSRDHELTVTARTGEDTIDVRLHGSVTAKQWRGAIERFELNGVLAGAWHIARPASLRLAADSATLEAMCWIGDEAKADTGDERDALETSETSIGDAEICLDGSWTRDRGGRGAVTAERLPLDLFAPLLAEDAALDGLLSLSAEGELDADGRLRADAALDAGPGALRYRLPSGESAERAFDSLRVRVLADRDTIDADMNLRLRDGTGLHGAITLPRSGAPESQPVRGQITGELHDNGLLGALVPDLAETAGVLRIDIGLDGTAAEPSVTGTIALEDVVADLPVHGLRLRDVDLRATGDGSPTWTVRGGAASGDGRVALEGTVRMPSTNRDWGAELFLSGQDFEVYQTSLAHVTVSPDLTLRAAPDRTEVTGEVRVPRSRITPKDLADAVPVSPDVVVLDDTAAEPDAVSSELGLHTNVRVVLGDSVHFDGFGLTGQLEGTVVVIDEPGRLTTGRGELRILDGEYTAYQQTLTIERGRLIFGDGPIEDPGLDMRVVRQTRDVLAGMNVRGTLSEPKVTLFSEPELEGGERDVLSYLLLGRLPHDTDTQEGRLLDDAATSIGLAGGDFLAGRLGRRLGLEEAYVETGDGLEDAALFLGTHLSPRLYVAYGIGLFDSAVSTIRLRYSLAGGWALRAESGRATGADLLYTIER